VDAFKTWEWKKKKKIDKQHFFSSQFLSLLGINNLIGSNFFSQREKNIDGNSTKKNLLHRGLAASNYSCG
jgi:hypothetical protein